MAGAADTKNCLKEGESYQDNARKLRGTSRDFNSQAHSNLAKAVLQIEECKYYNDETAKNYIFIINTILAILLILLLFFD